MSTRVLKETIRSQKAELIDLYQQNAKLKVMIAADYHKLSGGERESLINTLKKMQGPTMSMGRSLKFKSVQEVNDVVAGERESLISTLKRLR